MKDTKLIKVCRRCKGEMRFKQTTVVIVGGPDRPIWLWHCGNCGRTERDPRAMHVLDERRQGPL